MENMEVMRVVTKNGQLIFDDLGRVCLQDQAGSLRFVGSDCLPPNFFDGYAAQPVSEPLVPSSPPSEGLNGIFLPDAETSPMDSSLHLPQDQQLSQEAIHRAHWSRPEVLQLINSYKIHKHLFDNATIRNEVVWRKISNAINHHTPQEVQNKFKYLKQRYIKKKDSMGPRSTGGKPFHFDYFIEFDEIFGKDPNISPISVASTTTSMTAEQLSIFDNTNINTSTASETLESAEESPMPKRKRKSNLVTALQSFEKNARIREEAKERRHGEVMVALNRFNSIMQQVLEKM